MNILSYICIFIKTQPHSPILDKAELRADYSPCTHTTTISLLGQGLIFEK